MKNQKNYRNRKFMTNNKKLNKKAIFNIKKIKTVLKMLIYFLKETILMKIGAK